MKEISLNEIHQMLFPGVPYQAITRSYSSKPDFKFIVTRMLATGQIVYVRPTLNNEGRLMKSDWYGIYGAIQRLGHKFHSKQIAKNLTAIAATPKNSKEKPFANLRENIREAYPDWNFQDEVKITEIKGFNQSPERTFGYLPQNSEERYPVAANG